MRPDWPVGLFLVIVSQIFILFLGHLEKAIFCPEILMVIFFATFEKIGQLLQVNPAFGFDRTPTSTRLKRAVSSIISPLSTSSTSNGPANYSTPISKYPRGAASTTPSGGLRSLQLASCTNLMNTLESPPWSSRSNSLASSGMMPPPPIPCHMLGTRELVTHQ